METYEIKLKSPMGWIKVIAELNVNADNTVTGEAKLMGTTTPIRNGVKEGNDYHIAVSPKLPFGVLDVAIDVTVQPDGTVPGVANAARHKPMEITGQRVAKAA